MKFEITRDFFNIDGKSAFLLSGEIHYFRTPVKTWNTHLAKLKECGGKVVSFYIPWSWHEPEKDTYDFKGKTNPNTNLLKWLDAIKKAGLYCVVKPGPYMLAEYEDKGIPTWLTKDGKIMSKQVDMVTYMHPAYLERARKWYDKIFKVLKPYQASEGGPIIMMQICNEIGLFNWLAGSADYSETVIDFYRRYLKKQYGKIDNLNKVYEKKYKSFDAVEAPQKPPEKLSELARWIDFHEFHRWYFAEYLGYLEDQVRRRGISVPFCHNIAGWVYGQALEYPVNISMYHEIAKRSPNLLLAADHIPENISYRNAHHGSLVTRAVASLKQGKEVSYVAEMQAGSREDCVITYPVELELFYKKSFADGIKGMNLYMFSQGKNPERKGAFGPTFYWQTVLDYQANELPLYETVHRLGKFLENFGPEMVKAKRETEVGVVFYCPYWQTEFFYPLFEKKTLINPGQLGIDFDMKHFRDAVLVDTWIKYLDKSNTCYDIIDLQAISTKNLNSYKKLLVLTLPFMDAKSQEKLAVYTKNGGNLFFGPSIPMWNLSFEECDRLGKALKIKHGERIPESKIDIAGYDYIACSGPIYSIKQEGKAEIVAVTSEKKRVCGIRKQHGKGLFTCLSSVYSHITAEHAEIFNNLVIKDIKKGRVHTSDPRISATCLYSDSSNWLFAGNVHQDTVEGNISIPGLLDKEIFISLPPKASIFAPINLQLPGKAGKIIYSTADMVDLKVADSKAKKGRKEVTIDVYREKGSKSKILMELSFEPKNATIDDKPLEHSINKKGRILLNPEHTGTIQKIRITG